MKILDVNASLMRFLDELGFTIAELEARDLTAQLAPSCRALREECFEIQKKQLESRRDVTFATANLKNLSKQLKLSVRRFGAVLMVAADQNRRGTLYTRFFKVSPSRFSKKTLEKQVDAIKTRFVPTINSLEEGHMLKPWGEKLSSVTAAVEEALKVQSIAKGRRRSVALDVEEWKNKVNAYRMNVQGDLLKIAVENNLGMRWTKNFFAPTRRRSKPESAETEESMDDPVAGEGTFREDAK